VTPSDKPCRRQSGHAARAGHRAAGFL